MFSESKNRLSEIFVSLVFFVVVKYWLLAFFFFFFWLLGIACRILVPQPGIEPVYPAVGAWSLSHWIAREVPVDFNIGLALFIHNLKVTFSTFFQYLI